MKRTYRLVHEEARRRAATDCYDAPEGWIVTVSEPTRSLEQNAAQWPILQAFADQKQLCINGKMEWVTDEDWKDALTGAFSGEMRMAALDGKVIMLPQRTSRMVKSVFSEWLEFLHAMAAQMDVDVDYMKYPEAK
jgi:hypothetical protein